jgi:hypothetical protein
VENLQRNEKLRKLDLTVNFIDVDELLSVESLKINHRLEEVYLTGNPCTEFEQYRPFIIGTLPQLKRLDGTLITATERIVAQQDLAENRARLVVAAKDRVRQKGGNPDLVDAELVTEQEVDSDEDGAGEHSSAEYQLTHIYSYSCRSVGTLLRSVTRITHFTQTAHIYSPEIRYSYS